MILNGNYPKFLNAIFRRPLFKEKCGAKGTINYIYMAISRDNCLKEQSIFVDLLWMLESLSNELNYLICTTHCIYFAFLRISR
ncbi:MAG: hypothetical protein DWQ05_14315 [Calditrichaeota bacterium]|nr:MAG: hypothetical protein DWQ05_14315 [Calditrichota bacterium]